MSKPIRILFTWFCGAFFTISIFYHLMTFLTPPNSHGLAKTARILTKGSKPATILTPKSVLVLIGATGNYFKLALNLIDSAKLHFCKPAKHCSNVTYLVFTDAGIRPSTSISTGNNHHVEFVRQRRLGWPDDSMKRYHIYLTQLSRLKAADFILALDADLKFVSDVSLADIYGDFVATLHSGYVFTARSELPYESKEPRSKAYVPKDAGGRYFTAAIWGGRSCSFIQALRTVVWQLDEDEKELGANFTAAWHEESHLNRYLIENPPTRILSPSYYYPQDDRSYPKEVKMLPKKIMTMKKNILMLRYGKTVNSGTSL